MNIDSYGNKDCLSFMSSYALQCIVLYAISLILSTVPAQYGPEAII